MVRCRRECGCDLLQSDSHPGICHFSACPLALSSPLTQVAAELSSAAAPVAAPFACASWKAVCYHVPAFFAILLHEVNEDGVLLHEARDKKGSSKVKPRPPRVNDRLARNSTHAMPHV